ncbi:hypothetical protein MUY27_02010 [Mucilaginibacter sp. RS28]|uniref:Addiction module component n=1 Tax=Mucilaginibacter straminoryzae TaxID=2932774 RepID=A0A9X1X1X7_9SPHI|nr:hypothetical protein [Mucilaginibacter straminoryzae]MCJ8208465.1 hypothetical protein [Mucilaginibacter straminoryzae]
MLTKQIVKEMVDHLPDTFTVDDVVGELILLDKIDRAKKQFEQGEYLSEEEFDREIDSWE